MESPKPPPPPPPHPAPPPVCPYGYSQGDGGMEADTDQGCIVCDPGTYMDETGHSNKKCYDCNATIAGPTKYTGIGEDGEPIKGAAYCKDCVVPVCAVSVIDCDPVFGSVNKYKYYTEGLSQAVIAATEAACPSVTACDKTVGVETTRVCRNNQAVDPCDRVTRSPAPASPRSPLAPSSPASPALRSHSRPPLPFSSSRSPSTATASR
jgi:hypothetical protein